MVSIHLPFIWLIILDQGFSTGVLQEFVEHAVPDYLCRGTDLFFLRLSNKKMTTANTIAIAVTESKLCLFFLSDWQKIYFFGVLQNFSS